MKVLVYVEGPSDRDALGKLLKPVVEAGRTTGVGVSFLPLGGKAPLLNDVPRKAADLLVERPEDRVFVHLDPYPMATYRGGSNEHNSFAELQRLLNDRFPARAQKHGVPPTAMSRFLVHRLRHDLEALLLASSDQLHQRLETDDTLTGRWKQPVEDQNDANLPRRVVEALFDKYRKKPGYVDTTDTPWILERATLGDLEKTFPQHFGPFVGELRKACGLTL